jgi:hypothetical protein
MRLLRLSCQATCTLLHCRPRVLDMCVDAWQGAQLLGRVLLTLDGKDANVFS